MRQAIMLGLFVGILLLVGCTQPASPQNGSPNDVVPDTNPNTGGTTLPTNPYADDFVPGTNPYAAGPIPEADASVVAAQVCDDPQVAGVYACANGLVKIELANLGGGFRLVHSDYTIDSCPVVAPEYISENCQQAMQEGFCQTQNLCE